MVGAILVAVVALLGAVFLSMIASPDHVGNRRDWQDWTSGSLR